MSEPNLRNVRNLRNRVTQLEAELADLRADKNRLDYLQAGHSAFCLICYDPPAWQEFSVLRPLVSEMHPIDGETDLRQAIDKAMAAS